MLKVIIALLVCCSIVTTSKAQRKIKKDYRFVSTTVQLYELLDRCEKKMALPLEGKSIELKYSETDRQLYHAMEPWQTYASNFEGLVRSSLILFTRKDTSKAPNGAPEYSSTIYTPHGLETTDYGDTVISAGSVGEWLDQIFESARYSPGVLLNYFQLHLPGVTHTFDSNLELYTLTVNKTIVTLAIRTNDALLESVRMLAKNDLYGDVESRFIYRHYRTIANLSVPDTIQIEETNGKRESEVRVLSASIGPAITDELSDDFHSAPEKLPRRPNISVETYNDHIHFIDLKHMESRSLAVEFKDFILVAEAPRTSSNGSLIIDSIRHFAPHKPIRYFVFGHHHPDYIGGVRAFVHEGATILTTSGDTSYIHYIVSAPHTLEPDALQREPRELHLQELVDSATIEDGSYQMKIYYIGKKSQHTNDYLVYYFPEEKLLFEDDLAYIPTTGTLRKASIRQAGLYDAIHDLDLQVNTIVQSWPVRPDAKSIFSFNELEAMTKVKK